MEEELFNWFVVNLEWDGDLLVVYGFLAAPRGGNLEGWVFTHTAFGCVSHEHNWHPWCGLSSG